VAIQEVRWDEGCSEPADNYTFFHGNSNHHKWTGSFVHQENHICCYEGKIY